MSIIKELGIKSAENVKKVYEKGFDEGWYNNENSIVEMLRSPVGKVEEYTSTKFEGMDSGAMAHYLNENIPEVYTQGVKDWWLVFQQGKEEYGYRNAFWGGSWTDETYKPVIDIVALSGKNHNEMFRGTSVTDVKVVVDFKQSGSTYVFGSGYIEKIPLLKVTESVTYENWFTNDTALADITMSGVIGNDIDFRSSPLNKASIESIMGCLSATASGKTLTLKKTAVNTAFGINVDDTNTYPEGSEYYILRHSKDNWTVNYV